VLALPAAQLSMVSHDSQRRSGFTHALGNTKHLTLFWSSIDKITHKDYPAIRVARRPRHHGILASARVGAGPRHDRGYRQ